MTAAMTVCLTGPCPPVLADKKKFKPESADFTSYELVTFNGDPVKVGVEGTSFTVETEASDNFELVLCKADNNNVIRRFRRESGKFSVDFDGYMTKNILYFVVVSYQFGSSVISQDDNYIFLGDDGKVHFYKSPTYDFNVERCSELRDDKVSLEECLRPQNDIE